MAYYKPNLYSLKKQQMLNNITANSTQCSNNAGCGTGLALGIPHPSEGCGYTGVSGCHTNQLNDGPPSGENGGCRPNPANQGCAAHIQTSGCASHHNNNPPRCTTSANSAQFGGFGIGINDDAVSIDLDPYTNEIKITAGSSYPIELLAELCRELYT